MNVISRIVQHKAWPFIILGIFGICYVAFQSYSFKGVFASVQPDEYLYSKLSRQISPSEANFPYFIFFLLYRLTNQCGDHYLDCAHIMNAIWYAASMPFIYMVSRRVASEPLSLLVAIFSICGSLTTYITYFTPEPLYFFAFWAFTWGLFKLLDVSHHPKLIGVYCGSAIGIMMLIKLHAIFFLPGVLLFFLVTTLFGTLKLNTQSFFIMMLACLLSLFMTRFSLGYLIAGENGLYLWGGKQYDKSAYWDVNYRDIVASNTDSLSTLVNLAILSLPIFANHIMALLSIYILPLLVMGTFDKSASNHTFGNIKLYAWSMLLPLIVIISLLSAYLFFHEHGERLHLRIYYFIFPFFFIMLAARLSEKEIKPSFSFTRAVAVCIAIAVIEYFIRNLAFFDVQIFDAPELNTFTLFNYATFVFVFLGIGSSILWIWNLRLAYVLFTAWYMLYFTLFGAIVAQVSALKADKLSLYETAAIKVKPLLNNTILSDLAIVTPEILNTYQMKFIIDSPYIFPLELHQHACIKLSDIAGKNWVLLTGMYSAAFTYDETPLPVHGSHLLHVHRNAAERECTAIAWK